MFNRHVLIPAEGTIAEVRVEPGYTDLFWAPRTYVVDIRPREGEPFRAEVYLTRRDLLNFHQPSAGDITGFQVDSKSKKVEFDRSDPRNDSAKQFSASTQSMRSTDQMLGNLMSAVTLGAGLQAQDPNRPKWIVPAKCPNCGAGVEQAVAEFEANPHCAFCGGPLPVQPFQGEGGFPIISGAFEFTGAPIFKPTPASIEQVLQSGTPVQAALVLALPFHGARNENGEVVTALVFAVTPPGGGTPYRAKTVQHVPPEAQRLLQPGNVLPGRVVPGETGGPVVIDWEAALKGNPSE